MVIKRWKLGFSKSILSSTSLITSATTTSSTSLTSTMESKTVPSHSRSQTISCLINESSKPSQHVPNRPSPLKTDSRHLCHRHRYPSHRHRYPSHRHRYPSHGHRYGISYRHRYVGHCYPDCIRHSKSKNSSSCFLHDLRISGLYWIQSLPCALIQVNFVS